MGVVSTPRGCQRLFEGLCFGVLEKGFKVEGLNFRVEGVGF